MNDICEDCRLEAEYEDRFPFVDDYPHEKYYDFEYAGGYWPTTDEEYEDMVDYAEESGFWDDEEGEE